MASIPPSAGACVPCRRSNPSLFICLAWSATIGAAAVGCGRIGYDSIAPPPIPPPAQDQNPGGFGGAYGRPPPFFAEGTDAGIALTGAPSDATAAPASPSCPDAPPAAATPCNPPGRESPQVAHCSWGDDPRPQCRILAHCEAGGTWTLTLPDSSCEAPAAGPTCREVPPATGTECSRGAADCWFASGEHCTCTGRCAADSPGRLCEVVQQWQCSAPAAGCPTQLPQAGAACSQSGLECGPDCTMSVACVDGTWRWRPSDCATDSP